MPRLSFPDGAGKRERKGGKEERKRRAEYSGVLTARSVWETGISV